MKRRRADRRSLDLARVEPAKPSRPTAVTSTQRAERRSSINVVVNAADCLREVRKALMWASLFYAPDAVIKVLDRVGPLLQ